MSRSASDLDAIRSALSGKPPGSKSGSNDIKWYGIPAGTEEVRIRVLPPKEGKEFPFKMLMRHYKIPDLQNNPICPETFGMNCKICEVLRMYEGRLDLSEWASQVQCYANVQVKKDPTQQGLHAQEVYVLRSSRGLLKWFSDLWDDPEGKTIVDAYEGRDVIIKRKKFNGALDIRPTFSASSIADSEEEIQSVLSKLVDFDKLFSAPDDNDLQQVHQGAANLVEVIENKILQMAGDSPAPSQDPDLPNQDMPVEEDVDMLPAEAKKPVERPTVTKPLVSKPVAGPKSSASVSKPTGTVQRPATTVAQPKTAVAKPQSVVTKPTTALASQPKPSASAALAKPAAKPAAAKAKVSVPNDAPECFSNSEVYDENSDKCTECPHEFSCRESLTGSG